MNIIGIDAGFSRKRRSSGVARLDGTTRWREGLDIEGDDFAALLAALERKR